MRRVFISYRFGDRQIAHAVNGLFQKHGGRLPGSPVRVEDNLDKFDDTTIRSRISAEIERCDSALFLIGDDNHNSQWIMYEAETTIRIGLPRFVMRIPGKKGQSPPQLSSAIIYEWNDPKLATAMAREFQNRGDSRV
ncbi:MAG: hypothetical protein HC888_14535 [Candidatus Competibacteraceae bacterium]|nr:hypothetical protein [Candidatus Competibacteraceae bacterium]